MGCVPGTGDFPRKPYLAAQKEKGRRLLGVFPAQYPGEILWAMNILPVEIWDPPVQTGSAGAHLQPAVCSVVKLGLELILNGSCDLLDGFLFPHTCDSIQNLASVVTDYLGVNKPAAFFYHPKAPYWNAAQAYYRECLKGLVAKLEGGFGPLDPAELRHRVAQGRDINRGLSRLYGLRAEHRLGLTNREFYDFVRLREFLHPDDFLPLLDDILSRREKAPESRPSVILSGVLPNPKDILTLLDQAGVNIADDDLLACARRIPTAPSDNADPWEALAESYFNLPPCSTRSSPLADRLEYLAGKVKKSGASGVIFYTAKFCEPELFDVPALVEGLRTRGIPSLVVDVEVNAGLSGQTTTRVEAFFEVLDGL